MNKICPKCRINKNLSEFYQTKSRPTGSGICKKCFNEYCIQRWIQRKIEAIHYMGDECKDCKLHIDNTHYSVYDFHHLNSNEKDYDWTKLRLKSIEAIHKELDKCILLCSNCHRIRHSISN